MISNLRLSPNGVPCHFVGRIGELTALLAKARAAKRAQRRLSPLLVAVLLVAFAVHGCAPMRALPEAEKAAPTKSHSTTAAQTGGPYAWTYVDYTN